MRPRSSARALCPARRRFAGNSLRDALPLLGPHEQRRSVLTIRAEHDGTIARRVPVRDPVGVYRARHAGPRRPVGALLRAAGAADTRELQDVYTAGASWSLLTRTGRMATAIFKRARQAPLSGYLRPWSATFIDGVICRPQGRGNQAHDGGHGILPVGDIGSPHGRSFRGSPPGAIGSPHDPSRAHALVRAAAVSM